MFRRPSKTTNLRTVLGKALKAEKLQEALASAIEDVHIHNTFMALETPENSA